MPNWSNAPPPDGNQQSLPILRTPTQGRILATATSEDLIGCNTHYWGGRTIPCTAPDCPACNKGSPYRWHAYLAAQDYNSALHFIFECTEQATDAFILYRSAHGTLRGCLFKAERMHRRANGRVVIQTKPADLEHVKLPKPPDLAACMSVIWQLTRPEVERTARTDEPLQRLHNPRPPEPETPPRLAS